MRDTQNIRKPVMVAMENKPFLFRLQYHIFTFLIYFFWAFYAFAIFGIPFFSQEFVNKVEGWVTIYVSLFLVLRFNQFVTYDFTPLDKLVIFHSGMFLFLTYVIKSFLPQIQGFFRDLKAQLNEPALQQ